MSEADMLRGEKLLAQLQSEPNAATSGHVTKSTRRAQQLHRIHKTALAEPVLHVTTKTVPGNGKGAAASKKVETFNFKVQNIGASV